MKKIIPVIILILLISGTIIYYTGHLKGRLIGVVEPTIYTHTAEAAGKIIEMPVELGQHVKEGDTLAVLDRSNQEYAIEQLELTLQKKRLEASDLTSGKDSSQAGNSIAIASANYNSSMLTYDKAKQDYTKAQSLYQDGAITKDAFDNAKLKADTASAAVDAAKAQLNLVSSKTKLSSAELDVALMESQLQQQKDNLSKYTVKAEHDGVVMTKSYVTGDVVSPGFNLVEIASDTEQYLVFYLPKEELQQINYDQKLKIVANGEESIGTVKFMNVTSEYTPKDLQTTANKNKESIKIKLLLPADTSLKPGQEAEVIIKND